ncbi:hypothetical protein [Xenophilus sp. Marseille-Q4582]|uniref:hypothetical protein n=1 Tax=Xenophilus sp. Marseille-Q4582 TaxID=2866600 RepID=UPI001CE473D3|nr:hypothetical protein [Xenophilus sp. Marseille-Q4582]
MKNARRTEVTSSATVEGAHIVADGGAENKAEYTVKAQAALAGIAVYALSSGGYVVGRWGWGRELPDLRAVVQFLKMQGVTL